MQSALDRGVAVFFHPVSSYRKVHLYFPVTEPSALAAGQFLA